MNIMNYGNATNDTQRWSQNFIDQTQDVTRLRNIK